MGRENVNGKLNDDHRNCGTKFDNCLIYQGGLMKRYKSYLKLAKQNEFEVLMQLVKVT